MVQFPVNSYRFDPYLSMRFRVRMNGRIVAGVSKVSALKRSIEVVSHREGGDATRQRLSPSMTKFDPVTLERGITHDPDFEEWANKVYGVEAGVQLSLQDFRRDLLIEVLNEAGQTVLGYKIFRCWVSEYQALPELDANGHSIAFEHIVLQNEGWVRDTDISEPVQP